MSNRIQVTLENPHNPVCLHLIQELSQELGKIYGDDGSAAFSPDDVTIPRSAFVVAWLNDKAVGCGALRPMPDDTIAEIKRMFVHPGARGNGISRKILGKLEEMAGEFDYEKIWLETGTFQTEAIGLYESSDYQRMACYGKYVDNPKSLCYEKFLSDH